MYPVRAQDPWGWGSRIIMTDWGVDWNVEVDIEDDNTCISE